MNTYELLGRKTEALETLQQEYRNLLELVNRIKAGTVNAADVEVLPGDAWRINPPAFVDPVDRLLSSVEQAAETE